MDMVLFLLNRKDLTGLYNIGSGKAETWNSLVKAAFAAFGLEPVINYIDMPESLKAKYQYYTCADMDKMRAAGYTKEPMSLEDAIRDDIRTYLIPDKYLGDE